MLLVLFQNTKTFENTNDYYYIVAEHWLKFDDSVPILNKFDSISNQSFSCLLQIRIRTEFWNIYKNIEGNGKEDIFANRWT